MDIHSHDKHVNDKGVIDELVKTSSDNNIAIAWLFFRTLKRYVEEYKKTRNL